MLFRTTRMFMHSGLGTDRGKIIDTDIGLSMYASG